MKSSVETLDPTRVRLTVEVPFDELKPSVDSAYKRFAAQFTNPGFRKGRVPAVVIDQRVGRAEVLEALLSRVEVPLPDRLIEAQLADHFDDGHGDDEHRAEFEKQARESLTAQFVLDEIASKEALSVGEGELSEYIVRNAPRYGLSPDDFANQIVAAGQVPAIIGEVVRAKALAFVLERATVTDESGEPVDLEALRNDPTLAGT